MPQNPEMQFSQKKKGPCGVPQRQKIAFKHIPAPNYICFYGKSIKTKLKIKFNMEIPHFYPLWGAYWY